METTTSKQVEANTLRQQAETIRVLAVDVGFEKEKVVAAVCDGDLSALAPD